MAIWLNYNDQEIKGDVTAEEYEEWISLYSMQFGIGRAISMEAGEMANREAGRPSVSEVSISKQMDAGSTGLFKEALTGTNGKKVVIDLVQTGADNIRKFMSYELEDVLVSSYSVSASESGAPIENILLSFSKIFMKHASADKTNKAGTPILVGYDLEKGKSM